MTFSKSTILLLFTILICISSLSIYFTSLKYIKYLILPLSFFLFYGLNGKKISIAYGCYSAFLLILGYGIFSLSWGDLGYGLKDLYFISCFLIPLILFDDHRLKIKLVFFIYLLFFLLKLPGLESSSFSIKNSSGIYEGTESFVFGAFAVFFFLQRDFVKFVLSTVFLLITLKRIALLALIICIFVVFLPKLFKRLALSKLALMTFAGVVLFVIFFMVSGFFDNFTRHYFGIGVSELTLGRTGHYKGVIEEIVAKPFSLIYGLGVGSSYELAIIDHSLPGGNLHSDILKIATEYGLLILFFFLLLWSKAGTTKSRIMMLYTLILFSTDNALIYSSVMFFILMLSNRLEEEVPLNHSKAIVLK